jgi:hypothetical protein
MRPTDPPMEPLDGTALWIESGPDVVSKDRAMAGLMVRIGMAVNALTVQIDLAFSARKQKGDAVRQRDNMVSLVMAAALTFEALELARKNQGKLRPLLQRVGGKDDLLWRTGRLLGGKHPASGVLERARNSLAFHFDYKDKFIGPIVSEFAKNERIVWVEEVQGQKSNTVHRLSVDVLAHALLPDVGAQPNRVKQRQVSDAALKDVLDAMNTVAEYFTAAVVAYLREQGITTARTR